MAATIGFLHDLAKDKEVSMKDTATKHDGGKARLDLIAPEALTALGEVLAFGAKKYAARNWEKGMDWGRVYAAAHRHMNAWLAGEDTDPESGLSHLAHAMTNLHFLIAFQARGAGVDDRYQAPAADNDDVDDVVLETTKSGPDYKTPSEDDWCEIADLITMNRLKQRERYAEWVARKLREVSK